MREERDIHNDRGRLRSRNEWHVNIAAVFSGELFGVKEDGNEMKNLINVK